MIGDKQLKNLFGLLIFQQIRLIDKKQNFITMQAIDTQHTEILTIQEVADLLRVHRTTISRYAKSGELRSYLIGNRRLFKISDVWSFFDNQVDSQEFHGCACEEEES